MKLFHPSCRPPGGARNLGVEPTSEFWGTDPLWGCFLGVVAWAMAALTQWYFHCHWKWVQIQPGEPNEFAFHVKERNGSVTTQ